MFITLIVSKKPILEHTSILLSILYHKKTICFATSINLVVRMHKEITALLINAILRSYDQENRTYQFYINSFLSSVNTLVVVILFGHLVTIRLVEWGGIFKFIKAEERVFSSSRTVQYLKATHA